MTEGRQSNKPKHSVPITAKAAPWPSEKKLKPNRIFDSQHYKPNVHATNTRTLLKLTVIFNSLFH